MIIRLLGGVGVQGPDGRVRAGPAKRGAVFAVLAMSPNELVSQDALVHRVWGGDAPASVRSAVYAHVARLRKLLQPFEDVTIERSGDGYRLVVRHEDIDVFAMRAAAARARGLAETGELAGAVEGLRAIVAATKDRPLANVEGPWADRVRSTLRSERLSVLERLYDCELNRDRHHRILDELAEHVDEYPHAESLAGQLILALYRSGKQVEALARYAETDTRLRDDLGVEPGAALRELHRRILRQDPGLAGDLKPEPSAGRRDTAPAPEPVPEGVPRQLPPNQSGFTGRTEIGIRLTELLDSHRNRESVAMVIIAGMAGVGKTALAVRWAHQIADRFGDGQLFADLRGFNLEQPSSVADVQSRFLRALKVGANRLPDDPDELSSLYLSVTAEKQLLVVLDNAADAAQVRPLLPSGGGSLVVVTSRNRLSGLVATHGAQRVDLDVLTPEASLRLVTDLLGGIRVGAEPEAAVALVRLCSRLPLALRIAVANLADRPHQTISEYVAELSTNEQLGQLSIEGDPGVAVRPAFDLSFRSLSVTAQSVFRALSLIPGPSFTAEAVAAFSGELGVGEVKAALAALAGAHFVFPIGTNRFGMHDLLRLYSRERAHSDVAPKLRREGLERLYRWYLHSTHAADSLLYPDEVRLPLPKAAIQQAAPGFTDSAAAQSWLDSEFPNLREAIAVAAGQGLPSITWGLGDALRVYLFRAMDIVAWRLIADAGLKAATESGDQRAIAAMHHLRAHCASMNVEYDLSLDHGRRALAAARSAGDRTREAVVLSRMASAASRAGLLDESIEYGRLAVDLASDLGEVAEATALSILGVACAVRGLLPEGVRHLERASEIPGAHLLSTLGNLGIALREVGRMPEALERSRACVAKARVDYGSGHLISAIGIHAETLVWQGEFEEARELADEALELLDSSESAVNRADVLVTTALAERHRDLAKSIEVATEAVRLATETKVPVTKFGAQLALAESRVLAGDFAEAHANASEVLAEARHGGYYSFEGKALTVVAEIYCAQGERSRAAVAAQSALAVHRETGHRPGEARALEVLANTEDDPEAARGHREQARMIRAECEGFTVTDAQ